jgi:hypothetical protein
MSVPVFKNLTFNINIKEWEGLQARLLEAGLDSWNVIDQWKRTDYKAHYDALKRTPLRMILLKSPRKIVILVWATGVWDSGVVVPQHTPQEILDGCRV